jgi:beta-xylosidase
MFFNKWFAATAAALIFTAAVAAAAVEPVMNYGDSVFRPGALWLDNHGQPINAHGGGFLFVPGGWFQRGTYYWFGEHKVAGEAGNSAQVGVHVYSSRDLTSWKDEGIAFKVSADLQSEIYRGCVIERPKVIFNQRTKKFVMWFHLELAGQSYSAARSGVAIADHVTGPYTYLGSFRPNAGVWPMNAPAESKHPVGPEDAAALKTILPNDGYYETYPTNLVYRRDFAGGQMARDMTLFVDDDGKAYEIYASEKNGTLQISQLSDDYLKPAGRYIRIFSRGYNEAPALFKAGGRYFMFSSHCTGWAPNAGRLAVADSIWGPWQELANPWRGPSEKTAVSYGTQSTFVLPVQGSPGSFIFMADLWRPENPIDGRYVWLPIRWESGVPVLEWSDAWDMSVFKRPEFKAPLSSP